MAESSYIDAWFLAAKAGRSDVGSVGQVDVKDHLGNTALHYSAGAGHVESVRVLIAAKANVNIQNSSGDTPLHKAAWRNSLQVVRALVAGGPGGGQADLFVANHEAQRPADLARDPDVLAELSPPLPEEPEEEEEKESDEEGDDE